ncbi:MBL fold metallo-hydrolase [Pseudooceanicola onchidii]|uniref:MBL fold metallo-hydrolase n=1 Tax=Pseudooceanicola onchidii TaxID=2562279 RepID=UPI0010AA5CCF|nr:MBL fold metallo-hydrolase [Pseudooceanicola onchidii]
MYSDTHRELENLGNGLYAWVQGDGSWGWSNSGLIVGEDNQTVVIDTLFTGRLTQDMLEAYARAEPAAKTVDVLVNTHHNGDHTFGNHLVGGARIIGSAECVEEMEERPASFFKAAAADPKAYGIFGEFLDHYMGKFDFSDIEHVPPNETFKGHKTLTVGGRTIELTELGPAHTRGDIIVHVPDARVCYTGDLVFHGGHPIMWAGPVGNWIAACDHILGLDVDVIVPGHGPVSDKSCVKGLRDYFTHILAETTKCYEAGLGWEEAAFEVGYANFDSWLDRERVVANVATIYRDLSGGKINPAQEDVLRHMMRYSAGAKCPHDDACSCGHH